MAKKSIRKPHAKRAGALGKLKTGASARAPAATEKRKVRDEGNDAETVKRSRRGVAPTIAAPEEIKGALGNLLGNENALSFLKKNVSKWAPDVLNMLTVPKTDDYLAEKLGMKINAVRRILNLMQGYGITNYYVSKNTNGWLSFAWYVNVGKIQPFYDYINSVSNRKTVITDECDDYFMCNACYPKDKLIFTFDAAFENGFKCDCGEKFKRLNRAGAAALMSEKPAGDLGAQFDVQNAV